MQPLSSPSSSKSESSPINKGNEWEEEMRVMKRNGELEPVSFDKILQRFRRVGKEIHPADQNAGGTNAAANSPAINYTMLAMKVIDQLYDKISSSKIDDLCAEQCASLASTHPDYSALAGRIVVSSHHKNTDASFLQVVRDLYGFCNMRGDPSPILNRKLFEFVEQNAEALEAMIDYERDYLIDYFGFKTLERAYLMRLGGKRIVERPQHMWMRVAVAIHASDCSLGESPYLDVNILEKIKETYDGMSLKTFIHATPTLFNAGTPRPQLSSCFLVAMESDSIDGIYNTLKECATISKWAGGIGLHIHNIRASGSYIEGTGGTSNGIVPMLRVFNHTAKYVDQCVLPDTNVIYQDPQTKELSWRPIAQLVKGDRVHNLPIADPEGFGQALFLETNDTGAPNTGSVSSANVQPVFPGTQTPVFLTNMTNPADRDKYRHNIDTVKEVVQSEYKGEIIVLKTNAPAFFLRVTPEHPVLVVRDKTRLEWTAAKDVTPGTSLLIHTNTFLNVVSAETEWYEGPVYDLEMETYPNYMTSYGLMHNGGGKRNGSFAIYLEPWHSDIELFLQMRKNHGDEELKARDLFYALWVPDLFMERMQRDGDWTLMCPNECPGLADVHGDEFKQLYEQYEREQRGRKTMKARELWLQILDAQMETGTPYLCYKDSANRKSNQRNLGTIKSSNLCVTGSTRILTKTGYRPINSLCWQDVEVWNGEEWSATTVRKTGDNQEIMEVQTSDGCRLECTHYHKFYVVQTEVDASGNKSKRVVEKRAIELCCGDELIHFSLPTIDDDTLRGSGSDLADAVELGNKADGLTRDFVPHTASMKTRLQWLFGFFGANLKVSSRYKYCFSVTKLANSHSFLAEVKLMMQTLGINVPIETIVMSEPEGCPDLCELLMTLEHLARLNHLSQTSGAGVDFGKYVSSLAVLDQECMAGLPDSYDPVVRVSALKTNPTWRGTTFCFSEPKRHMGMFGGLLTGQCAEIVEYSDENETAVCNLASIALPAFVRASSTSASAPSYPAFVTQSTSTNTFDFPALYRAAKTVTYNLNRVIDINYYPTPKTELSNKRHRPIGIGVQGLADVFFMMGYAFGSEEAKRLNRQIFETIYFAAVEQSMELATKYGPYDSFDGSPASNGQFQFDLWNVTPDAAEIGILLGDAEKSWAQLKDQVRTNGLRNSLLLAPMPTASTSQILGYNECIEPITSNIFSRRTLAGEFILCNKYLMRDLMAIGLWNEKIKNNIIANNGSVQQLDIIPIEIREKYKTVWELSMKTLIDMAADRGAFIDQSQSLNLWIEDPNYSRLTSMHVYAWTRGLKTGIYYLRRRAKHQAQKFTIEPEKKQIQQQQEEEHEICEFCSA